MLSSLLASLLLGAPPSPAPEGPEAPVETVEDERSEVELELGARILLRPEARTNLAFGREEADSSWRIRQGARLLSGVHFRSLHAVLQVQDVREWGEETTTLSTTPGVSTHQAYLELSDTNFGARADASGYLRVGRQEVTLWSRRLLGQSPWQPSSRAFDAARGRIDIGEVSFEGGAILLRAPRTFTLTEDDGAERSYRSNGEQLYWAEASYAAHPAFKVHVATLALIEDRREGDPEHDRRLLTPGVYVTGEPLRGLKYELEGYGQLGTDGNRAHRAWAGAATLGYTAQSKPRPGLRLTYEIASGSNCSNEVEDPAGCGDQVEQDFEQHFGARHLYRGHADLFALSNMRDLHVRGTMQPATAVRFVVDYHHFSLYAPGGAWTNTGGNLVGRGWNPDNGDSTLGHELDFLIDYRPFEQLRVRPGYAVFVPTGAGMNLGGPEAQHFVYLWVIAKIAARWRPPKAN